VQTPPRARLPAVARRTFALRACLTAAILLTGACTVPIAPLGASTAPHTDVGRAKARAASLGATIPSFSHVAIVVMENHEYGQIIGNPEAPYVNHLAHRYGLVAHSYAISHPSLPNYLALIGGSTFGISSDCTTCHVHARNLIDQLVRHGKTWRAYMEDLPSSCFRGGSYNRYAKKHDPFLYFDDIRAIHSRCAHVVPLKRLGVALSKGTLPDFVFVSPNLCHDMHDCSVSTGDAFLKRRIPSLLAALGPRGVLFLTWDEGVTGAGCCQKAAGGHVVTILAGPGARRGARSAHAYDAYSILRTIEEGWRLRLLRGAACSCTRLLRAFLRR
jgi:hypothetical protein